MTQDQITAITVAKSEQNRLFNLYDAARKEYMRLKLNCDHRRPDGRSAKLPDPEGYDFFRCEICQEMW
jgi:hypothetical protein